MTTKFTAYGWTMRCIFVYRILWTNKTSDIKQVQVVVYLMKHLFVPKMLQLSRDFKKWNNWPIFLWMRMKIWGLLILNDTLQWFVTFLHHDWPINKSINKDTLFNAKFLMNAVNAFLLGSHHFTKLGYPMTSLLFRLNSLFFLWATLNQKCFRSIHR